MKLLRAVKWFVLLLAGCIGCAKSPTAPRECQQWGWRTRGTVEYPVCEAWK